MAAIGTTVSALSAATRCEIICDFDHLERIASDWNRLWHADRDSEVFQRFDWASSWWHAFGSKLRLFSPVVYENEQVIGILPLVLCGTTLRFLGIPGADYNDVICAEPRTGEVLNAAFSALLRTPGWKRCELRWVPEHSRMARHIRDLDPAIRRNLQTFATGVAGAMVLGEDRDKIITQFLRKPYLKRHEHKLAKAGNLTFNHIEDVDSALRHLEGLFQQHIRRRAMNGQPSQFTEPETRDFYVRMVTELDLTAELRFSVLALDGRPVAYHLGFETNKKFVMYKPTFDIDFWEYSPGDVLLYKLLEYARGRGINEYDFTIGSEHYKRHFVSLTRKMFTIALDRPSIAQPLTRTLREIRFGLPDCESHSKTMMRLMEARPKMADFRAKLECKLRRLNRRMHLGSSGRPKTALWVLNVNKAPRIDSPDDCSRLTISKLVDLALQNPVCIDSAALMKSRERLRAGDQCLGVEPDGTCHIAWLTSKPEFRLGDSPMRLNGPGLVVYDYFQVPAASARHELHPALLKTCIEQAQRAGVPLYVCTWDTAGLARMLRGAGFARCGEDELAGMRVGAEAVVTPSEEASANDSKTQG